MNYLAKYKIKTFVPTEDLQTFGWGLVPHTKEREFSFSELDRKEAETKAEEYRQSIEKEFFNQEIEPEVTLVDIIETDT